MCTGYVLVEVVRVLVRIVYVRVLVGVVRICESTSGSCICESTSGSCIYGRTSGSCICELVYHRTTYMDTIHQIVTSMLVLVTCIHVCMK